MMSSESLRPSVAHIDTRCSIVNIISRSAILLRLITYYVVTMLEEREKSAEYETISMSNVECRIVATSDCGNTPLRYMVQAA